MIETKEVVIKQEQLKKEREYYKILIVSPPGKGKTYMGRTLNPETSAFVNTENKPLPFKNTFKYHSRPLDRITTINTIVEYAKNPEIKCIFIDSFSAFADMVMEEARRTKKGFDVFNFYNEELAKFFALINKIKKEVILTAHSELVGVEGNLEKRAKVSGKNLEGLIEKFFTIVMFADSKFSDAGKPEYFLKLAEENTSAKCPPDIFGEGIFKIQNDAKFILDKVVAFAS